MTVAPILKKLVDDGLVEKKNPYFILSKNDKKIIQEEKSAPIREELIEDELNEFEEDDDEPVQDSEPTSEPPQ